MPKRRYYHLVEKPSLCGPTCIQMILLRNDIMMDQEEIAEKVNARVFPHEAKYFTLKLKTTTDNKEAGINLVEFGEIIVRNFFSNLRPALASKVFLISNINNVKDFIKTNIDNGNDLIANFHMKYIDEKRAFGHFVLIDEIKKGTILLCDPDAKSPSYWTTTVDQLTGAMDKKIDGIERGFVVISKQ